MCPLLAALVLRAWGCCWLLSFIVMALNLLIVLGLTELAIIMSLFRFLTALLMLLPEVVVAG